MKIIKDCNMADYVSFKAGGSALFMLIPESINEVPEAVDFAVSKGLPFIIMGNGSNLLFTDGGYEGCVIKIAENLSSVEINDCTVQAGAGVSLPQLARLSAENGLGGLEFAGGIPGTLGGGIFMNAGAYEHELKEVVASVTSIDCEGNIAIRRNSDCNFSYRHSVFMEEYENGNTEIILKVKLNLYNEYPEKALANIFEYNKKRSEKQPLQFPSAGSFFKRPEGFFAGKLIEDCGLKGLICGGARISDIHAGFIINNGNATASDIINLMHIVQETVFDKTGVELHPEVRIIGK